MSRWTHRQRMLATLAGETADRPAVALWRHFPVDDQHPGRLAAAVLAFQQSFDFDFIKLTPASSFCIRYWGARDEWQGNPEGTRAYTYRPVQSPQDWLSLAEQDPSSAPLTAQLECLRMVIQGAGSDTPVIQTIFSPLAQARNLAGPERLLAHLRQYPDETLRGLQVIARSTQRFVEAVMQTGADGVFYAVQHAQYGLLSEAEYARFGAPTDEIALQPAQDAWLNVLHLHGEAVMFDRFIDYPAAVINWHDLETPPNLAGGQARFNGAVCGGLRQWDTMVLGTPEQVQTEAQAALQATGGTRFVLGTGCVTPITAPYGNLLAARQAVEN